MKFEKKFSLSEIIAALALIVSAIALWQSVLVRQDTETINKLEYRPEIVIRARLQQINDEIPAHIYLKNIGPVDAIQLEVQFHYHKYFPWVQRIGASAVGSEQKWTFERVYALKDTIVKFNEKLLEIMLPPVSEIEKHYRIVEIRLNSRREADLKEYILSSFYFYNQDGKWVGEKSNSLNSDFFMPILKAVSNRFRINLDALDNYDMLHEETN